MLLANWRHSRRRIQVQQALQSETNFRRAMEDSMLTGMRALDLEGTHHLRQPGLLQDDRLDRGGPGRRPAPYPYWPEQDYELLERDCATNCTATTLGGFGCGSSARTAACSMRAYVSPLIDPDGGQTGWMTSITDITEPKRVREELGASYERFATVLDSLDAAISVAPLQTTIRLLFNKGLPPVAGPARRRAQASARPGLPGPASRRGQERGTGRRLSRR